MSVVATQNNTKYKAVVSNIAQSKAKNYVRILSLRPGVLLYV